MLNNHHQKGEFEEMVEPSLADRCRAFEVALDGEDCLHNGQCEFLSSTTAMCSVCRLKLHFFHMFYNAEAYEGGPGEIPRKVKNSITVKDLTTIEFMIVETLTSRYRLGEAVWTFPDMKKIVKAILALEDKNIVTSMHGVVDGTVRASLTAHGRRMFLSESYVPPNK